MPKERRKEKLLLVLEGRYMELPPSEQERGSMVSSMGDLLDFIGVDSGTFSRWMATDITWARMVRTAKNYKRSLAVNIIVRALERENEEAYENKKNASTRMAQWYAERCIPEYRDKQEVDVNQKQEVWEDVLQRNYAERKKREQEEGEE